MKYLHSLQPPVIHSDLKSKNVLVSERHVAKVSYCTVSVVLFIVCLFVCPQYIHIGLIFMKIGTKIFMCADIAERVKGQGHGVTTMEIF